MDCTQRRWKGDLCLHEAPRLVLMYSLSLSLSLSQNLSDRFKQPGHFRNMCYIFHYIKNRRSWRLWSWILFVQRHPFFLHCLIFLFIQELTKILTFHWPCHVSCFVSARKKATLADSIIRANDLHASSQMTLFCSHQSPSWNSCRWTYKRFV